MPYGLQCWDENGNLILDTTGRYSRLIYSAIFSTTSGSVDLPALEGHESAQWGELLGPYAVGPEVTRSGTTISWSYPSYVGNPDFLLIVFIYT